MLNDRDVRLGCLLAAAIANRAVPSHVLACADLYYDHISKNSALAKPVPEALQQPVTMSRVVPSGNQEGG